MNQTFTIKDGLASNEVQSILQDREGHLWFGGFGGVSRYDGKTRSTHSTGSGQAGSEPALPVLSAVEGSGTKGQAWTTFTTQDGLAHNSVMSIFQDREGNLWFGNGGFGAPGGGVIRYDGKTWTTFTTKEGLAHDNVRSIFQDREGHLWFGTYGGGVSRYDGQAFTTFTAKDGLMSNAVRPIFQDREGNLWFGGPGGVSRYDPSAGSEPALSETKGQAPSTSGSADSGSLGQKFTSFTVRDGLADSNVWSIFQDREGQFWFGTNNGVSQYDGQTWMTFTAKDGLAGNHVWSIFQDREGHLWFGTAEGGVSRYDGRTFTTFTTEDGLVSNWVPSIFQDREGQFWFGANSGVSRYDRAGRRSGESSGMGTFTTFTTEDGLASNGVISIFQDREGQFWFGTYGEGVSRYDGRAFTTFTAQDGLANNLVHEIFQDREGFLWFGTQGGGVSRYDPSTSSGRAFTTFTTQDGLANNRVFSIVQDQAGALWFGTEGGGVSRYDGRAFTTFTTQDGLGDNMVWSIFQDREGYIWFGTFGGVSRYDGQVFQTLTRWDGLANNVVLSISQDRDRNLWFGTSDGVTCYRPPAPFPPLAFIDAVVADRRYEGISELSIPSTARITIFEFHGMSFKTRPGQMVYRYRLVGYDQDWKNTRQRRVEYQDLPPGDYTFEVVAVDRDLVYSEKPAIVKITIAPDPLIEGLTEALSGGGKPGEFVGTSQALRRAQAQLSEVAWTDVTVLILGETGTGKGLAARAVHALSARREGPFIQVNCGAIPEGLVESELFGHEKGAFTGAVSRKLGKVEVAEGGTLFLDEIGDLPLGAQVKLLRVLEERTFERVGGTQTLKTEARVIAATNRDLKQMVAEGKFREDLYFRLQAFPVRLPPLRERREDIPQLAEYFIRRMASHLNKPVTHLTSEALALLNAYAWPGNIRELEHAVQRAVIVCRGLAIRAGDIVLESRREGESPSEEVVTLEEVERQHIQKVLERTGWVIRGPHGAAEMLGLHEATLRFRMRKLGIQRSEK